MKMHYTDNYLLNPPHRITVNIIGAGGTGSQVVSNMARISQSLIMLGHPGLYVRLWDNDQVTAANAGRQLFSPADIGQYKAVVLITRINRFYGFDWEAKTERYNGQKKANITITCVDTVKARIDIGRKLLDSPASKDPLIHAIYWLDLGNTQKTGQAVLGSLSKIRDTSVKKLRYQRPLPVVTKLFRMGKIKDDDSGPSCSLAEALNKQDLFINSTLAQFGCNLIWKLFREGVIRHHGCYVNLDTCTVNPIKIQ